MRLCAAAALAATMALAAACTDATDPATVTDDNTPTEIEHVRYLTGIAVQGRESFIYVAIEKGYFQEVGLEVEVIPGNGTTANLQLLQAGETEFAVVDITAGFIEYGKGTFTDFTIVSAIQQRNLACFMALEGSGITSPKDLEGKTIAFIPGGVVRLLFDAYADLAGIDGSTVEWVNMPPPQMGQALGAGTIDAATQFVVGEPALEAATGGKQAIVLPFSDYLTDLYGNGLGVSRSYLEENPDVVARFNQAMLKGLEYAVANPTEAGEIYGRYQQLQTPEIAGAEISLMGPYVSPQSGDAPIGSIDPLRAARNIAILQSVGIIPTSFEAEEVISFDLTPAA